MTMFAHPLVPVSNVID